MSDDMDSEECIHGLGPVSACVICNGRAQREALVDKPVIFPAKYGGLCPECGYTFSESDYIAWFPSGDRPVMHAQCWEET